MHLCVCILNKIKFKSVLNMLEMICKCHYKATGYFKGCGGISFTPIYENTIQYYFSVFTAEEV